MFSSFVVNVVVKSVSTIRDCRNTFYHKTAEYLSVFVDDKNFSVIKMHGTTIKKKIVTLFVPRFNTRNKIYENTNTSSYT
jgi:hypothetical protein